MKNLLTLIGLIFVLNAQANLNDDLCDAVHGENLEQLKSLFEQGVDVNAQGSISPYGTAFHCLNFKKGETLIAELLISMGAKIDATDKEGKTPLHYASAHGNLDIAKFLVSQGADINARSSHGETPFLTTLWKTQSHGRNSGRIQVAKFLIENGADINSTTILQNLCRTPRKDNMVDFYKLLVKHVPSIDVKDEDGNTLLHLAVMAYRGPWNFEEFKILVEYGADSSIQNNLGQTPLDIAIKMRRQEIISFLKGVPSVTPDAHEEVSAGLGDFN